MNRGSITIEMSIILPLVLLVLVTVIYVGIYLHDRSFLQSIANDIAIDIYNSLSGGEDYDKRIANGLYFKKGMEDTINTIVQNKIKNTKFFLNKGDIKYNFNYSNNLFYKEVCISLEKKFVTPFVSINALVFNNEDEKEYIKVESRIKYYSPTEVVNNVELLDDLTSDIVVTKKIKDKYYDNVKKIKEKIEDW